MGKRTSVSLKNLLLSLSEITDMANPVIAEHQLRTAFIAVEIAKASVVNRELIEDIFAAALLHDIGALSTEEKISLHTFEEIDQQLHCLHGEILLAQTPWLKRAAQIVRHHHTLWKNLNSSITDPITFATQVIYLADFVERLIKRDKHILHQTPDIIEKIKKLKGIAVHEQIIACFIEVSKREEFWLDLISPRRYWTIFHEETYCDLGIDLKGISSAAELFRDVIDFKSRFTATHTSGVAACAGKLAQIYGFSEMELELIQIAGNFHDIGKMIIPNSILEKEAKLTTEEFAVIKSHSYYTYQTVRSIGGLDRVAEWAAYHHEKLDGSGYPFHCRAEEIDNGARIMAVADIFTAISEDRPYRKGMSKEEIYKVLKGQVDQKLIDGRMVDLLFDNYDIVREYVWEKQAKAKDFYEKRFLNVKPNNEKNI